MTQIDGFALSRHAIERALSMGLEGDEIRGVLTNPRHCRSLAAGREQWTRGRIVCIVVRDVGGWAVVTFLWATANGWAQDAETGGSRGDKTFVGEQMRRTRRAIKANKRKAVRHG